MRGVSFETCDEGGARLVHVRAGPLELRLEVDAFRLEASGPGFSLPTMRPGALPSLDLNDGRRVLGIGDVKGLAAPALRLEVQSLGGSEGVRWTLEVTAVPPALTFELALENRSTSAWPLEALAPVAFEPADFFAAARPEPCFPELSLAAVGARHVALGFTTARSGAGRPDTRGAWQAAGTLAPGVERVSDRAWLAIGEEPRSLRLEWARRASLEMKAHCPAPAQVCDVATPDEPELLIGGSASALAATGVVQGLRVGVAEVLDHWLGNQRLWLTAPEPVGPELESLAPDALRTRLSTLGLAAGIVTLDGHRGLSRPIRAALGRVLPPLARPAWRVECEDPDVWWLVVPLRAGRLALLGANRSKEARDLGLSLSALGAEGPHHVYDFWENRYEGIVEGGLSATRFAPGACRVLSLSPVREASQVVGSSVHIGMGTLEVAALRENELVLRHPGEHRGVIWIAPGGRAAPRELPVRFRDRATLPV